MSEPDPPKTVGGYRLTQRVGGGPTGDVWLGRNDLGQRAAVKVIDADLTAKRPHQRLLREQIRGQAALSTAGVAAIRWQGFSRGRLHVVSEWVEGASLVDESARQRRDVKWICAALSQVAEALDAAHDRGVIHGNLQPNNVLLATDKMVRITDFGLSAVRAEVRGRAPVLAEVGAAYWPPESFDLHTDLTATRAQDVYALGCLAYECLTGQVAFAADLGSSKRGLPRPVDQIRSDVRADVGELLGRVLGQSEFRRSLSAGALVAELRQRLVGDATADSPGREAKRPRWLRQRLVGDATAHGSGRDAKRRARGGPVVGWLLAAAAVGVSAGAVHTPARPETTPISHATAEVPAGWHGQGVGELAAAFDLQDAVALGDGPGLPDAIIGLTDVEGPRLLPAAARRWLGPSTTSVTVRLGSQLGIRVDGLVDPASGGRVRMYAIPTTDGSVTVLCPRGQQSPATVSGCDKLATTIHLTRGKPAMPTPATAADVARIRHAYTDGRAQAYRLLSDPKTSPGDRQKALTRLAAAASSALRELARMGANPVQAPLMRRLGRSLNEARNVDNDLSRALSQRASSVYLARARRARVLEATVDARFDQVAQP